MNKTIVVAFGGVSPEHEVSVLTAMQAMAALDTGTWEVIPFYVTKKGRWLTGVELKNLKHYEDLDKIEKEWSIECTFSINRDGKAGLQHKKSGLFGGLEHKPIDAVIMAFHGSDGENGSYQGLFEALNLPYSGSGVMGSSVGMDKFIAKELARSAGIPVTAGLIVRETEWINDQSPLVAEINKLVFPVFVKPARLGSSIGVSRVDDSENVIDEIEKAFRYDAKLVVEEGVQPLMEVNCSALGNSEKVEVSVTEQPLAASGVLSFEDKYMSEGSGKGMASLDRKIPAPLSEEMNAKIQEYTRRLFRLFDCSGVARLDFLINTETNTVFFNEINTIPGSFSFYLWEKSEYPFPKLMERLIDIALENHRLKNGRVRSYSTNLLSQKAAKGLKGLKGKLKASS